MKKILTIITISILLLFTAYFIYDRPMTRSYCKKETQKYQDESPSHMNNYILNDYYLKCLRDHGIYNNPDKFYDPVFDIFKYLCPYCVGLSKTE